MIGVVFVKIGEAAISDRERQFNECFPNDNRYKRVHDVEFKKTIYYPWDLNSIREFFRVSPSYIRSLTASEF